jgi:hypothetical protein
MRSSAIPLLLLLGGCAVGPRSVEDILNQPRIRTVSAPSAGEANQGSRPEVIRYVEDPIIIREDLSIPVPEVWNQLLLGYADEGLAPDQLDESTRTVAVSRFGSGSIPARRIRPRVGRSLGGCGHRFPC